MKSPIVKYLSAFASHGLVCRRCIGTAAAARHRRLDLPSRFDARCTSSQGDRRHNEEAESSLCAAANRDPAPSPGRQRGLNVFESPKEEGAAYTGFKLSWGGAFTQQYQKLSHSNTAAPKIRATA